MCVIRLCIWFHLVCKRLFGSIINSLPMAESVEFPDVGEGYWKNRV